MINRCRFQRTPYTNPNPAVRLYSASSDSWWRYCMMRCIRNEAALWEYSCVHCYLQTRFRDKGGTVIFYGSCKGREWGREEMREVVGYRNAVEYRLCAEMNRWITYIHKMNWLRNWSIKTLTLSKGRSLHLISNNNQNIQSLYTFSIKVVTDPWTMFWSFTSFVKKVQQTFWCGRYHKWHGSTLPRTDVVVREGVRNRKTLQPASKNLQVKKSYQECSWMHLLLLLVVQKMASQ